VADRGVLNRSKGFCKQTEGMRKKNLLRERKINTSSNKIGEDDQTQHKELHAGGEGKGKTGKTPPPGRMEEVSSKRP